MMKLNAYHWHLCTLLALSKSSFRNDLKSLSIGVVLVLLRPFDGRQIVTNLVEDKSPSFLCLSDMRGGLGRGLQKVSGGEFHISHPGFCSVRIIFAFECGATLRFLTLFSDSTRSQVSLAELLDPQREYKVEA